MNFFIKQNSSWPVLVYPLTKDVLDKHNIDEEMLENVAVTFSMVLRDENIYKIANVAADLYINEDRFSTEFTTKYNLIYKFKEINTNKHGIYDGEFKIDFLNGCCGKVTIPEIPIQIVINPSITKTNVISSVVTPTPPTSPQPPVVIIGGNTRVLEGNIINLTSLPSGMATYSWTGPNGFTSNLQNISINNSTVDMSGTYSLSVVDGNGLSGSSSIDILVYNTWKFTIQTNASGATNINQFMLPTVNGYNYDAIIDWGDNTTSTITSHIDPNKNHEYLSAGTYQITISGLFEAFSFGLNNSNDSLKLISLDTPIGNDMNLSYINNGFFNCMNLNFICNELFKFSTNITDFNVLFGSCTSLTTIPSDLFSYNPNAVNFSATFYNCTSLTTIPVGLFSLNAEATSFVACFYGCTSLTSIPDNIFDNNINVTNFSDVFNYCTTLTTIPENIFINNINVINYSATFANNKNLILPSIIFNLSSLNIVTDMDGFMEVIDVNDSYSGTIQDIWLYATNALHYKAFLNQTNLTNYSNIPSDWKNLS